MKKYLLFDLDGTLTDPKVGICTCVQYALSSFGIEEPDIDKLEPFIGPPLKDSFMQFYQMSEAQAEAAVAKYRERFSDVGLFENTLYEGVPHMLQALCGKGMFLAVASSKPTVFVERILEHFQIRKYFKVVVGSELDGRRVNKDEVVGEALRQLFGDKPVDKAQVYMIGDRRFDVEGAKAMGVESVGVTYGYGGMEELREAKADYIVRSVEELEKFLLRGTEEVKKGLDFQRIWKVAYPFLLFLIVRMLGVNIVKMMYASIGGDFLGIKLLDFDQDGQIIGITANGNMFANIVGFIAGAMVIKKGAGIMIKRAAEDSKLLHIKKDPAYTYGLFGILMLFTMLAGNLFMLLSGVMGASDTYQQAADKVYTGNLALALLLTGLVAPIAEEMLFRGIIYNSFKRSLPALSSALISAAFFGVYHGNSVQGIYGFVLGLLFIYAYDYYGDFKVPVLLHILHNVVSYLLTVESGFPKALLNWGVCGLSVCAAVLTLYGLKRTKKVFV